jgi:uncharacterized protein
MTVADGATGLLQRIEEGVRSLLPTGAALGDAHTHLGLDEDGMTLSVEELLAAMEANGIARALTFPLHDPERAPAYRVPNDRVLAWAAASEGRLVPLARLDLNQDPIGEARRAIAAGARGIKLHPRAQAFDVDDHRLEPVFALAEEHRMPVLIHAGRGMPPIGAQLATVAARHPGAILILAHAAIVDQDRICSLVAGRPNVFFDTSTWGVADVLSLFARVAPEQVLWATDLPYGNYTSSLGLVASLLEELDAPDAVRRSVVGEGLEGIIRGELPALSAPLAPPTWELSHARQRIYAYTAALTPLLWGGQEDRIGLGGLALGACDDRGEDLSGIATLLGEVIATWSTLPPTATRRDRQVVFKLLHLAQVACYAPGAARRWLA